MGKGGLRDEADVGQWRLSFVPVHINARQPAFRTETSDIYPADIIRIFVFRYTNAKQKFFGPTVANILDRIFCIVAAILNIDLAVTGWAICKRGTLIIVASE